MSKVRQSLKFPLGPLPAPLDTHGPVVIVIGMVPVILLLVVMATIVFMVICTMMSNAPI